MIFSSLTFIFLFLPLVLLIYYLTPRKYRNLSLFLTSLIFYSWGEPRYILIMVFSTVFDYYNGILIGRARDKDREDWAKIVLIISVIINLGILGFFKYSNFFLENINNIFKLNLGFLKVSLPIGISFYTFQTMSYTIDVYRGDVSPEKNIINFGTYVTLFPQLVAGPIVRYQDISLELKNRRESIADLAYGIRRFIIGLAKKVLLANNIGLLFEDIARMEVGKLPVVLAWLGALAFSFQIYFDFSGYSDMAIGLGRIFGFRFLENFNYPYVSRSITEFWRRWHISLSTWFREYVYIPLGGNRKSRARTIVNLFITWGLTGFWHGASWNFVLWGLYFFLILFLEKAFLLKYLEKTPKVFSHVYSLGLIIIGWVIFSMEDMTSLKLYLRAMFGLNNNDFISGETIYLLTSKVLILIICSMASTRIFKKLGEKFNREEKVVFGRNLGYIFIFFISICFLIGDSYNPFLYFRF